MTIRENNSRSKDPATKGDIKELWEDLQGDMAPMEEQLMQNTSETESRLKPDCHLDLSRTEERITMKLDEWGGELAAAKTERVDSLADKVRELDDRVALIERRGAL